MLYIKKHNEELYDYIKKLHEEKENKRNSFFFKVKKKFARKLNIYPKIKISQISELFKDQIISDACDFMNVTKEVFYENINKHWEREKELNRFNNQEETDIFWNSHIDNLWLSLNIDVQLTWYDDVYSVLLNYLDHNMSVADYGCGTGSLSFVLNKHFSFNSLDLYDLPNYASEFIKFAINKNKLKNVEWSNILENIDKKYDAIICLDVLEHLENSYTALLSIDSKLKKGGYLMLKIAFESEDKTHLPQSAENFFFTNNGITFLNKNYKLIHDFYIHGQIINGLYKKIR